MITILNNTLTSIQFISLKPVLYTICTNIYNIHGTRELQHRLWKFDLQCFPQQFKNILRKNITIFIIYLTPFAEMASSFKFWDATPPPDFDWEMVICGSKFNKYCSKFLRQ